MKFIFLILVYIADVGRITDGLKCFSCEYNYYKPHGRNDKQCLIRYNLTRLSSTWKLCAHVEQYCAAEVATINNILSMVWRGCKSTCHGQCEERGFGLTTRTCKYCCGTDDCNGWTSTRFYLNRGHNTNHLLPPKSMQLTIALTLCCRWLAN